MKGEVFEAATRDGVVLRGLAWSGSSPAVLLVHEPGEERDLDDWRPLLPYLLGDGAAIVALDLRGHGASDGEWDPATAADDIAAVVTWCRQFASHVVAFAAGASAPGLLRAAETVRIDGIALLSASEVDSPDLRGAGVSKLLLVGGHSAEAKAATDRLRAISIGPALTVSLPTEVQGSALLESPVAVQVREHLLRFLREQRAECSGAAGASRQAPDFLLERLGFTRKGARE